MFNLGGMEILVILVVALVVLGPDKLPKFMRSVGKSIGELRRVSTDFQRTLSTELESPEVKSSQPSRVDETTVSPELSEKILPAVAEEAPPETSPLPAPEESQTVGRATPSHGIARPIPQGRARSLKPQLRKKLSAHPGKDSPEQV